MPFWDDAKLSDLPDLADRLFLVDVFQRPERFRFSTVGESVGHELAGRFLDETALEWPLEFVHAQCSVTTECAAPTCHRQEADESQATARPYSRLLLPMWGDGGISMLLGAVALG
jgi:hypothetical protein